jgi:Delta7-sterol 5-desaturase
MTGPFIREFMLNSGFLALRYFLLCGVFFSVFYIIFKQRLIKHKIQVDFPTSSDFRRDILYSISSTLIFSLVFSLTITVLLPYTMIYDKMYTYGYGYYWLTYPLMLVVHDTYFYWTHRLIHTRRLFKVVHLVHHRSHNPSPWTSYAFHPTEAVIQSLVMPMIALLFPVHKFALIFYFLFQFMHNIYGHLGFELLPAVIRETFVGRQLNTSIIHNRHHKNVEGNYGLYFTFWDKLMGTLKK